MPKAAIQVVIQPFTDSFAQTGATPKVLKPYRLDLTSDPSGRVTVTQPSAGHDGSVAIDGPGEIQLSFKVVDNARPSAAYVLSGIVFGQTTRGTMLTLPPKTGRDNFPDFNCLEDGSLEVRDKWKDKGHYQFLLLVQNSDGGVAIIDPLISNQ